MEILNFIEQIHANFVAYLDFRLRMIEEYLREEGREEREKDVLSIMAYCAANVTEPPQEIRKKPGSKADPAGGRYSGEY